MIVEMITFTIIFNIVRTPLCLKCTMSVNRNQNNCVMSTISTVQTLMRAPCHTSFTSQTESM